jgi:release factor glutamine methyltransferase
MTVRQLLTSGYRTLFYAEADTPFLDAAVLLAFAMGLRKEKVLASLPEEVDGEAERRFREFLDQRAGGKPVSYIRRAKEFYGLEFYVDERVLVPRPDTETLIERVLELRRAEPWIRDLHDTCTGSGCIGITLKRMAPELRVSASDISPAAGEVFRLNAERLLGSEIPFYTSDLLDGVPSGFDVITANPPYLRDGEVDDMVRIGWPEPPVSLRGGKDGTQVAARLIRGAATKLKPRGWLILEAAPDQFIKLFALMDQAGFRNLEVDKDLGGRQRVISGMLEAVEAAGSREGSQAHG